MQDSVNQDREKYIGGSDIAIIMNLSPFKSRFDLLLEKAGYKEDTFEGNIYTEYGNALEPIIRTWINAGYKKKDQFKEGKFVREATDGEIIGVRIHTDGENSDTVLEIKTTSQIYETVREYKIYLVQLLYYMVTKGKTKGLLAVYERPEDLSVEFTSDRLHTYDIILEDYVDVIKEINTAIESFIEDLQKVIDNPFITESELLPVEIPDITARILAFESQLEYMKNIEKKIKEDKDRLKKAMISAGVKSWKTPNGYTITRVDDTPDTSKKVLDEKKLKEAEPDIYNKYLIDKTVSGKAGYIKITAPSVKEG